MSKREIPLNEMIHGRAAVVTGATRGIGFAIARSLLEAKARVAISGRSQASVDQALDILNPLGDVFGVAADMSKRVEVDRFIASVNDRFHGIDILVNNAGLGTFRSVGDLPPEEWDRMIALNLSGPYYCSHAVLPILKERGGGDIINISSLAGKNAFAGGAGYNASKFGLNGFSEAMMLDHRDEGVRVSYVMPGSVDTEFGSPHASNRPDHGSAEWKIAPEDIADVVMLLLRMPRRTLISRVEIRPSRPAKKG